MALNREEKIRQIEEHRQEIRKKLDAAAKRAERKLKITQLLKARLIFCVLSVVIVVSLILTVFNVRVARRTVEESLQESMMPVADLTAEVLETKLQSYAISLGELGKNTVLLDKASSQSAKEAVLASKKEELNYLYGTIISFDNAGTNSTTNKIKEALNSKEYYISSPYYTTNQEFVFDIVVPVVDQASDQMVGALSFAFNPRILSDTLSKNNLGKNSFAYILDKDGVIIASTDYEKVTSQAKTENSSHKKLASVEEKMLKGERGNVVYIDGVKDRMLLYTPVPSLDWTMGIDILEVDFAKKINDSRTWSFLIGLVLVFVSGFLVSLGAELITKPMANLSYVAKEMAKGNFEVRVDVKTSSEIGLLADSLILTLQNTKAVIQDISRVMKSMENKNFDVYTEAMYVGEFKIIEDSIRSVRDSVSDALKQIKIVGDEVASGANEVANASQSLAQGATEQASAVQELSATITEIHDGTMKNTEYAHNAVQKVEQAGTEIEISNGKMQELMAAMEEMTNKSNEISKIVKTIDDIAFQTNILALNAAVEAARAGAAGKGFAVVADEVRNLASKSAEAAKTTTALIDETTKAIAQGTQIARETADSLTGVVNITHEVIENVNEISNASEVQASSVGQITTGVDQISAVVQTNSATSEESAAAAEQLSSQAQALDELLSQFIID